MKKAILCTLLLSLALVFSGCLETTINPGTTDDPNDPNSTTDPTLGDTEQSACKDDLSARQREGWNETDPGLPYPYNPIEAQIHGKNVTIFHHDAYYQCGAEIAFALEADGRDLLLREIDTANDVTDCMCFIDLSVELQNLTDGTYHIEVWDEFKDTLFGEVNVTIGECPDVCETDADCARIGAQPIDCEGDWACIEGQCRFQCNGDMSCESDRDCPDGYSCVWYDTLLPGEEEWDENGTPIGGGTEDMPDLYCEADADCPEGMWCEYVDCDGEGDCGWFGGLCVGGGTPYPTSGVCEPTPWECDTARDCEGMYPDEDYGMRCPGFWNCENHMCFYECSGFECMDDSDCPNGQYCEYTYGYGEDGTVVPGDEGDPDDIGTPNPGYMGGTCVPYQNECYTDSDCPVGFICEVYWDDDMAVPGDPEGDDWIEPGMGGVCVPVSLECSEDRDCPSGYHCEYYEWFDENGDGYTDPDESGNDPGMPPYGYGECVADGGNECETDSDCYGYFGEADPSIGMPEGGYICVDGYCEAACWNTYECYSDDDCGENGMCVFLEMDCDEDDYTCCGGSYCEYGEPMPCAANADCPADMACVNGLCVEEVCACPEYYYPVCGIDGITYDNECFARCAGAEIAYEGFCGPICPPTGVLPECDEGFRVECREDGNGCPFCECVPAGNGAECTSNQNCGFGEYCTVETGACLPAPGCEEGMDCIAVCYGTCCPAVIAPDCAFGQEPVEITTADGCIGFECRPVSHTECSSDSDCPRGMHCDTCPPDPDCPICAVCGPPVCVY